MIQRKQTLYLLLITVMMTIVLFVPLAQLAGIIPSSGNVYIATETVIFDVWGIHFSNSQDINLVYFGILTALCVATSLVSIFLYKKRTLQLRLCYVIGVMLLGVLIFEVLYGYSLYSAEGYTVNFSTVMLLPLISLPFAYLAGKGIIKDIALVKSYDRIR